MSHRGKRRAVVEVLDQQRAGESGPRFYTFRVRLECGHITTSQAAYRYRKDAVPKVAFCTHPACVMADGVAA